MSRSVAIAPVASRLGPYLAKEGWAPLSIWLVRFKRKLGLRADYGLIELLLTYGAGMNFTPEISLADLSRDSGVPLSTLHYWSRSLVKKGYLQIIQTRTASGDFGPNRYAIRSLLLEVEALHRALITSEGSPDLPETVSGLSEENTTESGDGLRSLPETGLRTMPEAVIDSGETHEERRDAVPPDREKQFRGLALAHATAFKLKAGSESFRGLWRALHDYAARHELSRREIEVLLSLASQDKKFLTPDGLWDGLDHFRAALRKGVAA